MSDASQNTTCTDAFAKAAKPRAAKPSVSPLSLRLCAEERARLERDAAGLSLSAYVRGRLFDADVKPRRSRGKAPVKDHQALAKVLAALGRSELIIKLEVLQHLLETKPGDFGLYEAAMVEAVCADVHAMRSDLMKALGLRGP